MLDPLPPSLVDRPFSVRDAVALGVDRQRLRRLDLEAPFHGVRTASAPETHLELCRALTPVLQDDQFVSHSSSSLLWGLPLPWRLEVPGLPIHVTLTNRRESRRSGVIGHRNPKSPPLERLVGIPVSSPVAAWVECRELLEVDELIVMGDALIGRWSKIRQASELPVSRLVTAARAAPARNAGRLREALELIRPKSRSPAETRLRLLLVRSGLPEPELNYDARSDSGAWLGCVDMAYPSRRLSIEYEGEHHFEDAAQYREDIERRERFAEAGWRTIRVTSDHLRRPQTLVTRIARHLGVELT